MTMRRLINLVEAAIGHNGGPPLDDDPMNTPEPSTQTASPTPPTRLSATEQQIMDEISASPRRCTIVQRHGGQGSKGGDRTRGARRFAAMLRLKDKGLVVVKPLGTETMTRHGRSERTTSYMVCDGSPMPELREVVTLGEPAAEPDITLKALGTDRPKKHVLIYINGAKAGFADRDSVQISAGYQLSARKGYRTLQLWSGQFSWDGIEIALSRVEKLSDIVPKIRRLIRSHEARKQAGTVPE